MKNSSKWDCVTKCIFWFIHYQYLLAFPNLAEHVIVNCQAFPLDLSCLEKIWFKIEDRRFALLLLINTLSSRSAIYKFSGRINTYTLEIVFSYFHKILLISHIESVSKLEAKCMRKPCNPLKLKDKLNCNRRQND